MRLNINGGNLGKFYRFVNSRLSNKRGVGILKDTNGVHLTSDSERAELLNNYYCSACTHDDGISPSFVCDKRAADTCLDCVTFSCANIQ